MRVETSVLLQLDRALVFDSKHHIHLTKLGCFNAHGTEVVVELCNTCLYTVTATLLDPLIINEILEMDGIEMITRVSRTEETVIQPYNLAIVVP